MSRFPSLSNADAADRASRHAALSLGLSLPADTVLYLLLPMYAAQFGVSLAEAGVLLAANRLVRIAGYAHVARAYARHGDRPVILLAVGASALCALGYATLSGFWTLLPLRLLWGLAYGALNLSTQTQATARALGAARRTGRAGALVALGPVLALPLAACLAQQWGPRPVFFVLSAVALGALPIARRLPDCAHPTPPRTRRLRLPGSLDLWSFLEGLTLDGLFVIGLAYFGSRAVPQGAVWVSGVLLATRYLGEILLSPLGGRLAERLGAERLLLHLSILTALALLGFSAGWLWSGAAAIVVLRALQLPLLAPIVAHRTPGPGRVQALAARAVWRDIGAGAGPLLAGLLLPLAPPLLLYGVPAALLALAAWACVQRRAA